MIKDVFFNLIEKISVLTMYMYMYPPEKKTAKSTNVHVTRQGVALQKEQVTSSVRLTTVIRTPESAT